MFCDCKLNIFGCRTVGWTKQDNFWFIFFLSYFSIRALSPDWTNLIKQVSKTVLLATLICDRSGVIKS